MLLGPRLTEALEPLEPLEMFCDYMIIIMISIGTGWWYIVVRQFEMYDEQPLILAVCATEHRTRLAGKINVISNLFIYKYSILN